MILSIKSEQRKENRFIMMRVDSEKRVRFWIDIRQDASLGYQDVKRRDKRSLMDRIIEFFADIKDFPENL